MFKRFFNRVKPGHELKSGVVFRGERPMILKDDEEEQLVVIPTRLDWRKRSTELRVLDAVNRHTKN